MPRSSGRKSPRGQAPVAAPRRDYCTYFDHRYLAKGLALYRSLEEYAAPFRLFVLALSQECEAALQELKLEHLVVVPLGALERSDPEFLAVKGSRSTVEYYFTSTAPLMRHLLASEKSIQLLTYLDADVVFFSSPEPIFLELEGHSIGIVGHRFPERLRHLERYGTFNVGWVSFRRDPGAAACLEWWRSRCLEWCFDREEGGKFADQKYLDDWPSRFAGVRVIAHPGADLAPWNLESHRLTSGPSGLLVDGAPLIFFHAHRFDFELERGWEANFDDFGLEPTGDVRKLILEPYGRALEEATRRVIGLGGPAADELAGSGTVRSSSLIALRSALRESEADRAARLEVIRSQDRLLAERDAARIAAERESQRARAEETSTRADLAAQLEVLHGLDRALRESEADRAERLTLIERLGRELNAESARLAATAERASTLEAEVAHGERARAALQGTVDRLDGELAEARARIDEVTQRLDLADADRAARLRALESVQCELERLRASWSWRLSWPLRALGALVRRR